jgi:D-alanine--poly(phosphoribitol) ligase subunit 1
MVPSQIIIKDALPLNPNGKIDRKLLDTHARTN